MSTASSSLTNLTYLIPSLLYLVAHVAMLGACLYGALHPSLRREFIWLGLGSLLQCVTSVIMLIPQLLQIFSSHSSSSFQSARVIYQLGSGINVISMVFLFIGLVLLAMRARSLPVVR